MEPSGTTHVRCTGCETHIDVSHAAPFTRITCPECGTEIRVKCQFGPFKLVRLYAVGGMSMVFAAHDATLDREVALKILNEDYSADERRIAAFEQEARITASLSHPNVVKVFRTGRAFGRFYIAMEMVPGGHLEERIHNQGRIPESEILPLAIEVALGLQAAHNAGLIHRDVKPGNILLDAGGHARLVDFGLALVTQGGTALASEIWATPFYVPPEAIDGQAEDFRSDIYAFGSSLYHALSGQPPCGGQSMSTEELREAKKKIPPLAAVEPSVSAATCRIVDRAMQHDPALRYESYQDLLADLRKARIFLEAGGIPQADVPPPRPPARRLPGWSIAAAIAIPVVLAIAFWPREKPADTGAQVPARPATTPTTPSLPTDDSAAPALTADESAEITRQYRSGRSALEMADYRAARRSFAALFANDRVQEPTRSWAAVEAVLAALLGGETLEAHRLAQAAHGHLAGLPPDHPLAGAELITLLNRAGDFPPLPCPQAGDSAAGIAAAMLAGLKNWNQGLIAQAAECFQAAKSATLAGNESWCAIYQKIAGDHLADHEVLQDPAFLGEPASLADCEKRLARLNELAPSLKTRGRAVFNIDAWRRDLRLLALRFATAGYSSGQQAAAQTDPEDTMRKLRELTGAWRFNEAADLLESLSWDPPGASREAMIEIHRSAAAFHNDLEQDLAAQAHIGRFTLKSGQEIVRIAATNGSLTGSTSAGADVIFNWNDLTADSLIELHRELVKNSNSETTRLLRHERAIAFDWLVGRRDRAVSAADNLGKLHPLFQQRWQRIRDGLPQ